MNWPLFWALALTFGFVIGNIMLVKRSATQKMPSLKDLPNPADAAPKQRLMQVLKDWHHTVVHVHQLPTDAVQQLFFSVFDELNARLFSLHEHNENERIEHILEIAGEDDVLVVSDAGMRSAKIVGGEDACTQDVWATDTLQSLESSGHRKTP